MSAETFREEQIISGIRIFWNEILGCESRCDPDMNLIEQLKAEGIYEDIDLGDVLFHLKRFFGFECAWDDWETFLGVSIQDPDEWNRDVAPRLTFRALSDFIRERLEPISLEPITILGKRCRTAGIFRALERLAGQVHPNVRRFAPSTPIRARLRGSRLQKFWNRLRWVTEDQIPLPRRIKFGCGGFYVKIGIGIFIALWKRDLEGLWLSLKVTAILFLPTAFLIEFLNSQLNPLPKEIKTFGDLARYLAVVTENQQPQGA